MNQSACPNQSCCKEEAKMEASAENNVLRARKKVTESLYTGIYGDQGQLDPLRQHEHAAPERPKESPYNINNILWLLAAVAVFYFTDFPGAVLYDPRVHRVWLKMGGALIGLNVSIALFFIVYLSWMHQVPSTEWERRYPAAIPIATAAFTLGAFCVTVALWPLWGFLTPLFLFVLFMGIVVIIAMLPHF